MVSSRQAAAHVAALAWLALSLAAVGQARPLEAPGAEVSQPAPAGFEEGWMDGRATWYDHPHTGSCGYGKLNGYAFGPDAVAAMPDVFRDYNTSCGRCYEVRCRGIQAISADSAVNLDRHDACYDTSKSIIVKITDTCPCNGNEKWCCGDMDHFDLSAGAFSKLAPQGKGIIGLQYRPVPCSMAVSNESATPQAWDELRQDVALGAGTSVFVDGELGLGWKKTVYGDAKRAMYTYDSSVVEFSDKSAALCGDFEQWGGFDFHTQKPQVDVFVGAQGVEFWVETQAGIPDMTVRLGNIKGGSCGKEFPLSAYANGPSEAGWTKAFLPISDFECIFDIKPENLNRVQWENKVPQSTRICVKDVRIVRN